VRRVAGFVRGGRRIWTDGRLDVGVDRRQGGCGCWQGSASLSLRRCPPLTAGWASPHLCFVPSTTQQPSRVDQCRGELPLRAVSSVASSGRVSNSTRPASTNRDGATLSGSGQLSVCHEADERWMSHQHVGPVDFPEPWREFVHAACRMVCNTLEHVDQPSSRLDAVKFATGEETVGDADVLGANLVAGEQNVLLALRNQPDGSLEKVDLVQRTCQSPSVGCAARRRRTRPDHRSKATVPRSCRLQNSTLERPLASNRSISAAHSLVDRRLRRVATAIANTSFAEWRPQAIRSGGEGTERRRMIV